MSLDVLDALLATLPDATRVDAEHLRVRCGADAAVLEVDPVRSRAVDVIPYLRLLAPLPALGGFELDLTPRRRRFAAHAGDDGGYQIVLAADATVPLDEARATLGVADVHLRSNDRALAAAWLDPPVRQALVDALQVALQWGALRGVRAVVRGPRIRIDRDRLEVELEGGVDKAQLPALARAAAAFATAPARIGRAWASAADALGGRIGARAPGWDLHGPTMTVDRGGVAVVFDNTRGGAPDEPPGLCTRARAHLPGAPAPWRLLRRGTGRGRAVLADYVTPAAQVAALRRLLGPASGHLAAAQPDALVARDHALTVRWDGLLTDPARLGPALELIRAIVAGAALDAGPYR